MGSSFPQNQAFLFGKYHQLFNRLYEANLTIFLLIKKHIQTIMTLTMATLFAMAYNIDLFYI
jgi:hypothetical protein